MVERELLDFAVEMARKAGRLAAERFFDGSARISLKSDDTEVTDADLAVEELYRSELSRYAPADEVYGEEAGTTAGTSGRRWIIDPIDGTSLFARGIPTFNTRIAYEDEHGPAIGIINYPVARRIIFAGRGLGCWLSTGTETSRVRVATTDRLGGARTTIGNPGTWPEELLLALHRRVFLIAVGGTIGLVTGQVDAFVTAGPPMGYEDVAPLPVLIGEAGGRVTDLTGADVLTGDGSVLATNGLLHTEFLGLVAGLPHVRDWRALGHV